MLYPGMYLAIFILLADAVVGAARGSALGSKDAAGQTSAAAALAFGLVLATSAAVLCVVMILMAVFRGYAFELVLFLKVLGQGVFFAAVAWSGHRLVYDEGWRDRLGGAWIAVAERSHRFARAWTAAVATFHKTFSGGAKPPDRHHDLD